MVRELRRENGELLFQWKSSIALAVFLALLFAIHLALAH